MKRIKSLLIVFISLFMIRINALALGASLSVSSGSIENGGSVTATATLSGTAAWNIKIISSGATSGCTQGFADATQDGNNTTKYLSVTCRSTSTGIINFVLSGDITSSDGTNTKVSDSRSVNVVKPREKSTNNDLKSLSVEGYEISPAFDKKIREYTVSVPSTVDKINIIATKADGYASLSGAGEHEVEEGANLFEIIVTSETGVANKYTLTVNVEDVNPIVVKVKNKKYTLVKNKKNLVKPDLFEETTIKIKDTDIPAFINKNIKCTLVGLKDENGKIKLFIYKDGKYTLYNEYKYPKLSIMILDMKSVPKYYKKASLKINGEEVDAYRIKGDSRYLVYGRNLNTGEYNYYTYDSKEKTLQLFSKDLYNKQVKENEKNKYLTYALYGVSCFLFLLVIITFRKCSKLKKNIKKVLSNNNIEIDDKKKSKKDNKKEDVIEEKIEDKKEEENSEEDSIDEDFSDIEKKKKKKKKKDSKESK